jgi:hypothetical protein
MALSTYSLVSLDELKEYLGVSGGGRDNALESILNRVTDEIEDYVDRQLVTRTDPATPSTRLTEYHTMPLWTPVGSLGYYRPPSFDSTEIWTLQWPIITVTSVHEDRNTPRTYGTEYLLVSGTDYETVAAKGLIRRMLGADNLTSWAPGHRAIRVIYSAGYATTADVPARIKTIALRYASLIWAETERRQFGVSSASDATGNFTRFSAAQLTPDMQSALASERRWPGTLLTGEAA